MFLGAHSQILSPINESKISMECNTIEELLKPGLGTVEHKRKRVCVWEQHLLIVLLHGAQSFTHLYSHRPIRLMVDGGILILHMEKLRLKYFCPEPTWNSWPWIKPGKDSESVFRFSRCPYLYTRKKVSGKTLSLIVRYCIYAFSFQKKFFFFLGEERVLWSRSKGETQSRILGFGEQGYVFSGLLRQCALEPLARRPMEEGQDFKSIRKGEKIEL